MAPPQNSIEGTIIVLVQWLRLAVETLGAAIVALGVCVAIVQLIRTLAGNKPAEFTVIRLIFARYLTLVSKSTRRGHSRHRDFAERHFTKQTTNNSETTR